MFKFNLIKATLADKPALENMWYYYVYDLTRYCGFIKDWKSPTELSFKSDDITECFSGHDSHFFVIKIGDEYAGFAYFKKLEVMPYVDWFMNDFYIISKYQRSGLGKEVAKEIFEKFPGEWSVGIIPEHKGALSFWRNVIKSFKHDAFIEEMKTREQLQTKERPDPYPMVMLRFNSGMT